MEQFCKALHPNMELGTVCVAWFRCAIKHCSSLMTINRLPTTYFWSTVKNFIFPDRSTEIVSQKVPISIHPHRLTSQDCQSLFMDIVNDYIQRAPRYAAESMTNVMLWQVLYSLMGIMALGSLLIGIVFAYNKYGQPIEKVNHLEQIFKPEKRMAAAARRSLRLSKAEVRHIRLQPKAKPEQLLPADGVEVMALKVATKYEVLEGIIEGCLQSTGKFHRLYDQHNKTKTDFKIEALAKAMKFLDNNCQKLHLLLMFEENEKFEENQFVGGKRNSPRIKNISPQRNSSSKISNITTKRTLNSCKMEGESVATPKMGVTSRSNSPNVSHSSNHSIKQTTPRNRNLTSHIGTAIPRSAMKCSPNIGRKTK